MINLYSRPCSLTTIGEQGTVSSHEPKQVIDKATSNTLATCFCCNRYDAVGPGGEWPAWYSSHIGGTFAQGVGCPMTPEPDGLVVGYLDASARFVRWSRLPLSNHQGDYLVHYDHDK